MQSLRQLFRRRQRFDDLSEEIRQHLAEKTQELIASGMHPTEAEHAARRAFGNVGLVEQRSREVWIWSWLESLLSDMRLGLRRLNRSRGFALTAMLTLAFGIGANVVVFSVLNGLLLTPLPVPQPNNLFLIEHASSSFVSQSYRDYVDFRDRDSAFQGLAAYGLLRVGLRTGNTLLKSWGQSTSGNYFDVLGVHPELGRFFHAADIHGPASAPYVVLSYGFWQRQFHGDPHVVGRTVDLNRRTFTVIGVAPKGFHGAEQLFVSDFWVPLVDAAEITGNDDLPYRDHYPFIVVGRLKRGISAGQATQSLNILATQMARQDSKDDGLTLRVAPLGFSGSAAGLADPIRDALFGFMFLAALVLLAACANLAAIFAARTADRSGELAIRLAIGSSRLHILRQLLVEAVLVSLLGGVVGTLLATGLLASLTHLQPFGDLPVQLPVMPTARVYLTAFALSLVSGLVFGLLPARTVWRVNAMQAIRSGVLRVDTVRRRFALRDLLLLAQIAICTLLVTASLVAVRGMQRTLAVPLGFAPQGVTLAQADLRMAGLSGEQVVPIEKRMEDAAASIPGVTAAAVADSAPFDGGGDWFVYREGTTDFLPAHMRFDAMAFLVSPGYFKTADSRLLAGRDFTAHDNTGSPDVAIVNETFAREMFGDTPAVGRRFALWAAARYEVVGVVADGKYNALNESPHPAMFLPLAQGVGGVLSTNMVLLVRSPLPQDQLYPALRRVLIAVEPSVPFVLSPWRDRLDLATFPARASMMVLSVMGLLAAILAVTGIFGMASYSVTRRMREGGIRLALGAPRTRVLRALLLRPVVLLLLGIAAGVGGGLLATRLLSSLVSYATPHDPLVLAGVWLIMALIGFLGTLRPARRALSIDPARILRES